VLDQSSVRGVLSLISRSFLVGGHIAVALVEELVHKGDVITSIDFAR